MSIPNTTPTPNELFNGEMKNMSDAELRVTLIVTRATFGWIADEKTGLRKEEDWISHSQMIERSGRSSRAISSAIASCINKKYIEARSGEGKILATPEQRRAHGKKIFYRLGECFLGRIQTIANNANLEPSQILQTTIAKNDIEPSQILRTTKETLTKETLTKVCATKVAQEIRIEPDRMTTEEYRELQKKTRLTQFPASEIQAVLKLFEPLNPAWLSTYKMTSHRLAADRMLELMGIDELRRLVAFVIANRAEKYMPTITTICALEKKMGDLAVYYQKQSNKAPAFI